jgi:hemerythrin
LYELNRIKEDNMSLIEWNDDFSVRIEEIDNQHKKLIEIINELHYAMRERKAKEALGNIINGLVDYAVVHFSTEERYFDQFNYLSSGSHKKEHRGFMDKVNEFKTGFENGKIMLSLEIMDFLKDWLIKHIQKIDMAYAPFFHEKGLK